MTEHEQLVERVARGICDVWGYEWDGDPDDGQTAPDVTGDYDERPSKELFRMAATSVISTIAEALREPTEKMVKAMLAQVETGNPHDTPTEIDVRHGYTAMLSASPLNGEQK